MSCAACCCSVLSALPYPPLGAYTSNSVCARRTFMPASAAQSAFPPGKAAAPAGRGAGPVQSGCRTRGYCRCTAAGRPLLCLLRHRSGHHPVCHECRWSAGRRAGRGVCKAVVPAPRHSGSLVHYGSVRTARAGRSAVCACRSRVHRRHITGFLHDGCRRTVSILLFTAIQAHAPTGKTGRFMSLITVCACLTQPVGQARSGFGTAALLPCPVPCFLRRRLPRFL